MSANPATGADGPGIAWEPGEEDYPFPTLPGESALDYLRRWLADAGYARIESGGVRFVHEEDMVNLINQMTADVDLLRARLAQFGDRVVVAADHETVVNGLHRAVEELSQALDVLRR